MEIADSWRTAARDIEHTCSVDDDVELDLRVEVAPEAGGPLPITASLVGHVGRPAQPMTSAASGATSATGRRPPVSDQIVTPGCLTWSDMGYPAVNNKFS